VCHSPLYKRGVRLARRATPEGEIFPSTTGQGGFHPSPFGGEGSPVGLRPRVQDEGDFKKE